VYDIKVADRYCQGDLIDFLDVRRPKKKAKKEQYDLPYEIKKQGGKLWIYIYDFSFDYVERLEFSTSSLVGLWLRSYEHGNN
jgi:hypothetical protein